MTSFLELVQKRRSVRAYDTRPVEREKIERCLEAARLAPSACNAQPWKFTVIQDAADIAQIAKSSLLPGTSMNRFVQDVPIVIGVTGESPNITSFLGSFIKRKRLFFSISVWPRSISVQAVEEDLGTCMLGWFNERKVKRIFGIPRGKRLYLLIALGYPADSSEEPREKNRKTPDEMRRFESYR